MFWFLPLFVPFLYFSPRICLSWFYIISFHDLFIYWFLESKIYFLFCPSLSFPLLSAHLCSLICRSLNIAGPPSDSFPHFSPALHFSFCLSFPSLTLSCLSISCPLLFWLRFQSLLISSVRTTKRRGLWADESIRNTDSGGGVMKRDCFWGSVFCLWSLEKGHLVLSLGCIGKPARSYCLTFFFPAWWVGMFTCTCWMPGTVAVCTLERSNGSSYKWGLVCSDSLAQESCLEKRTLCQMEGLNIKKTFSSLSLPDRKQLVRTWGFFFSFLL